MFFFTLACCQPVELCVHLFRACIYTLREEFGEISRHLIQLTYRGHAPLSAFAPVCVFLETRGRLVLPCQAIETVPVHFVTCAKCLCACIVCARLCLSAPQRSSWIRFVNSGGLCLSTSFSWVTGAWMFLETNTLWWITTRKLRLPEIQNSIADGEFNKSSLLAVFMRQMTQIRELCQSSGRNLTAVIVSH